jgi:hypothetical protein
MGRVISESEIDRVMQYDGLYKSREEARQSLETLDQKWIEMLKFEMRYLYGMGFMLGPDVHVRNDALDRTRRKIRIRRKRK